MRGIFGTSGTGNADATPLHVGGKAYGWGGIYSPTKSQKVKRARLLVSNKKQGR